LDSLVLASKSSAGRVAAILCACFMTVFIAFAIRYSYGTLLPGMLPQLGITKAQAGIIYSTYFITNCVMSPVIGILSDRFDLKYILSGFVLLMGVGTFLMQFATTLALASLLFAIVGLGCSACWAPVILAAQRWTNPARRGMVLSFVDAGTAIGVMTVGTIMPIIASRFGWQQGWSILGLVAIAIGLLNFVCIRNRPIDSASQPLPIKKAYKKPGFSYRSLFRNHFFWLLSLAYMLNGFAIIIPFTFLSTYAVQELHTTYDSAGLLITIIGFGGLIGKITLGPLSDRTGRVSIMITCGVLIAGGNLLIPFCHGLSLQCVSLAFGLGFGACWAMYAACATEFFSKESAGGIIGIWSFFLGIGSFLGPIIAGFAADVSGSLKWGFMIAGIGGTLSMLLLLPLFKARPVK